MPSNGFGKILVVGAGGIGCELLKNLILEGFNDISIIDLDTIDISNLNRQFLFQKQHVGRSKAEVARESVLRIRPDCNIVALHKSVLSAKFDVEFFSSFNIIFNALDNQAARRHVNRLCVAAQRPLIESGTAGYLGQVEPLLPTGLPKNPLCTENDQNSSFRTGCYECQLRGTDQRTFPACTIRNTPSEPVHCVVWAKYLFNQLFGEPDRDDEDVSPDFTDPELQLSHSTGGSDHVDHVNNDLPKGATNHRPISTYNGLKSLRDWFRSLWMKRDTTTTTSAIRALVWRLFHQDILTLLEMRDLWVDRQDRRAPTPLAPSTLNDAISNDSDSLTLPSVTKSNLVKIPSELRDQRQLTQVGWLRLFMNSVEALQGRFDTSPDLILSWDKDDTAAMDFVAGASILRSQLFHLPGADALTRFVMKSLAGNIIPAIATTNAIIAGFMVLQAKHILDGFQQRIRTVYLPRVPTGRRGKRRAVVSCDPPPPNPSCYVCNRRAIKSQLVLICDPSEVSLRVLRDRILIQHLGMLAPDVELEDRGVILISSEEGETDEDTLNKPLSSFHVTHGARLQCDDFRQDFSLCLVVSSVSSEDAHRKLASSEQVTANGILDTADDIEGWRLVGDLECVLAASKSASSEICETPETHSVAEFAEITSTNELSLTIVEPSAPVAAPKRPHPHSPVSPLSPSASKRPRPDGKHLIPVEVDDEDDVVCLD